MINLSRDGNSSKVLSLLRFPLAALVVFIHTEYPSDKSDAAYYLGTFFSYGLAQIAVPAFFFISGYLFFARYERFGVKEYASAMRKKALSLALPYLLWIGLVYYGMGLLHGAGPDWYPLDFYKIFWAQSQGYVVHSVFGYEFSILSSPSAIGVMWFIRDLMVAMVLSPIVWWIVRRMRMWSLVVFFLPYLLYIGVPVQGFGLAALCFFPAGATFSICGKDVVQYATRCGWVILVAFTILLGCKFAMDISSIHYHRTLSQLFIVSGIAAVFVIGNNVLRFPKAAKWLIKFGEASFLLYVVHTLPLFWPLNKMLLHLRPIPYFGFTMYYILSWGLRVGLVLCLYYVMKRLCPKVLSVLVGGRISQSGKSTEKVKSVC